MKVEGKVWVFGDHVDTDAIVPGKYLYLDLDQMAKHTLTVLDASFPTHIRPGDVIVAGRNFGCGSSREQAPRVLRKLGVAAVFAESFARIFFRNAIAVGLPAVTVPGIHAAVKSGDVLRGDLATGVIENRTSGTNLRATPIPERMLAVLNDGGVLPALKRIAAERARERG